MKTFTLACRDMGMMDCPFRVTSEREDETKNIVTAHAMKTHAEKMDAMSDKEKDGMGDMMDSLMHIAVM